MDDDANLTRLGQPPRRGIEELHTDRVPVLTVANDDPALPFNCIHRRILAQNQEEHICLRIIPYSHSASPAQQRSTLLVQYSVTIFLSPSLSTKGTRKSPLAAGRAARSAPSRIR